MIYLPAGASRTTTMLRRSGWVAGSVAAGLTAAVLGLSVAGHLSAGPGALYAAIGITAVAAATLIGTAAGRSMVAQSTMAITAELGRVAARGDRQDETLRQVVAEMARLRGAVQFGHEALAERVGDVVAEALVVARREGEMRGFARGLAAARQLGDGDTGPLP